MTELDYCHICPGRNLLKLYNSSVASARLYQSNTAGEVLTQAVADIAITRVNRDVPLYEIKEMVFRPPCLVNTNYSHVALLVEIDWLAAHISRR